MKEWTEADVFSLERRDRREESEVVCLISSCWKRMLDCKLFPCAGSPPSLAELRHVMHVWNKTSYITHNIVSIAILLVIKSQRTSQFPRLRSRARQPNCRGDRRIVVLSTRPTPSQCAETSAPTNSRALGTCKVLGELVHSEQSDLGLEKSSHCSVRATSHGYFTAFEERIDMSI